MISLDLLRATEGRAVGSLAYGGAGLKKTHAIATLIPPVLLFDIGEGGTASIAPWVRRKRNAGATTWTNYTDADRQLAVDLLRESIRGQMPIRPNAYVDIIHFDNMKWESWDFLVQELGNFNLKAYNSLAIDSLQEFSESSKMFSKGQGNEGLLMNDVAWSWVKAQERAQIHLRKIRNFRDSGVFIYLTGAEGISKDYVKNPMEKGGGGQEPYSIRGTVNLPGQLADAIGHIPDLLFHARLINNRITWVSEPEPLPGGGAWWDAKDRYGRLDTYCEPNFRRIFEKIYGKEGMQAIYGTALESVQG